MSDTGFDKKELPYLARVYGSKIKFLKATESVLNYDPNRVSKKP
jgi:hypothetical protein